MPSHFIINNEPFVLEYRTREVGNSEIVFASIPYNPSQLEKVVGLRSLKETHWPYWLEEWPAVYALAELIKNDFQIQFLNANSAIPTILDLGCGSGFLAAFLFQSFGIKIFNCDFNFDACRLAQLNSDLNSNKVTARTWCADFNAFPIKRKFEVVLAGEMLYTVKNHAPILKFLQKYLCVGGTAYFADPGRSAATGFLELANAYGFETEVLTTELKEPSLKVNLYKLLRQK